MSPTLFLLSLLSALPLASAPTWNVLEPGLAYRQLEVPVTTGLRPSQAHVFQVDLKTHAFRPIDARSPTRTRATVREMARGTSARVVVNGTYFDERDRPLGLLIGQEGQLNPLRRADWGVFSISEGRAELVHTSAWRRRKGPAPSFAIQVGPRCVIGGDPVKLKPQIARRAALGIQHSGQVVIVISTGELLSSDLARFMARSEAEGGLGCRDAVMLDGGGSAQLWAEAGGRRWSLPGAWPVPNAVALVPR